MLIWPHSIEVENVRIFSDEEIDPNIAQLILSAKALQPRSGVAALAPIPNLYFTNGGWRWKLLALTSVGAFALSFPGTGHIIFNRSSVKENRIYNGRLVGGIRSLDRAIAHELAHGILRREFGVLVSFTEPKWLVEGFCDYVADSSSLTEKDVVALRSTKQSHPALPYYEGRIKVQALIEKKKMSLDQIFAAY